MIFLDLSSELDCLQTKSVSARVSEFASRVPMGVYVIAIGGFPIYSQDEVYHWCEVPVSSSRIAENVMGALGISGLLTFMNKSCLSLNQLGNVCIKHNHTWGYHWITFSLLFVGYDHLAELALTRDKQFWMSWPVGDKTGQVFMASGSIKSWLKFVSHHGSKDWDASSRKAMKDAMSVLKELLP